MTRRPMPRAVGWSLVLWALVVLGGGGIALAFPRQPERLVWLLWLPLWASALVLVAEAWRSFWEDAPVFEMKVPILSADEALLQWNDARRALWFLPLLGVGLWPLAWGQHTAATAGGAWRGSAALLWVAVAISVWIFRRRQVWFLGGASIAGVATWWAGTRAVWESLGSSEGLRLLLLGALFVVWCGMILRYLRGQWTFRSSFQIAWGVGVALGIAGLWAGRSGAMQTGQRVVWWGLCAAWGLWGVRMLWRGGRMIREQRLFQSWSMDAALFAVSVPWACLSALGAWEIARRSAVRQGSSMEMVPVLGWLAAQALLYAALLVLERLHDTEEAEGWGSLARGMMFFGASLFVLGIPAMVFLRP